MQSHALSGFNNFLPGSMDTSSPDETSAQPAAGRAAAKTDAEISLLVVTERVLLSALRARDAALAADFARKRAQFLADASLRFGASLDEELTYAAIAGLELPGLDAWCVVDVVEAGGGFRRIAVLHPDDDKQDVVLPLAGRWKPSVDDLIGIPAIARDRAPVVIIDDALAAISMAARDEETLSIVRSLGAGSLLVLPVIAHEVLFGAMTYVSRPNAPPFSPEDVLFGEGLAARCAQALESARLYAAARASWVEAESARADAENAARVKGEFLTVMSHELRTPLNAIGGYAELIELGVHGPVTPAQAKALARIQQSQRHLLGLINSVLNYSRVEAGAVDYAAEDVPMTEVLATCEALVAPQARAKQLNQLFAGCDSRFIARADPQKVQQIVLNLLSNAIKFTEPGGSITLDCVDHADGILAVRVIDTGHGIEAAQLERVFQPFVRLDSTLTRTQEGTGLGLSISRDLARAMGGDLKAESRPNMGSTFTLTLPAVTAS
ncbi:MAG: HAMP domain-containing histidine kinase [Gemmatimonadaceae bacterium]|nr:HAMP domain-containing histidine kinase [Gemmatimonadaceae bacterium]